MKKVTLAHDIINVDRTEDVLIHENATFESLLLSPNILRGLTRAGFLQPSPIQLKAIPIGRCGFDLIVQSKSGTGKTLVFSIIALEVVDPTISDLQALILAPTREIAVQITDVINNIGSNIRNLKVSSFIGGLSEKGDIEKAKNCQIAVGAPGRIKSLIKQNILKLDSLKFFVLDEADKLVEETFQNDINEMFHKLPKRTQIIAASATFPAKLEHFLSNYMRTPTKINAEGESPLLLGLKQYIIEVELSSNIAQEMKNKNEKLHQLLSDLKFTQCIIFTNYQTRAESISLALNHHGWKSTFISAAQTQVRRLKVMGRWKKLKNRILLSTDLTSRGIDAANVDLIINYDIPHDVMTYLHRMGRAGRYGSKGVCITLISGKKDVTKIRKFLGCIGGTTLTISKLSKTEKGMNLWETDDKDYEQIGGILDEDESDTDSCMEMKNKIYADQINSCQTDSPNSCHNDSSEDPTNVNEEKKFRETKIEQGISNNSRELLKAMASETFNFNDVDDAVMDEACQIDHDFTSGDDKDLSHISNPKVESNNILHLLAEGEFNFSELSTADNTKTENSLKDDIMKKDEIYLKNVALYETAKILLDPNNVSVNDISENVNRYLNLEKNQFNEVNTILSKNYNNKNLQQTSSQMSTQLEEKLDSLDITTIEEKSEKRDDLENVFLHSYLYAIDEKSHWKNYISDSHFKQISEEVKESSVESEEHEEYESDSDYDETYKDHPGILYDENGKRIYAYEDIPNRMVWLPVNESVLDAKPNHSRINLLDSGEENETQAIRVVNNVQIENNSSSRDQYCSNSDQQMISHNLTYSHKQSDLVGQSQDDSYRGHFQHCSNELWENGCNFNSVEEFDYWFYHWQERVKHVSDYVRQNIYVKEMSDYQDSVRKY